MTPIRSEHARQDAIEARREELLTVKEYAFLLQQNPKSVYRRIAEGRQAGVVRDGRDIRIDVRVAMRGHQPAA